MFNYDRVLDSNPRTSPMIFKSTVTAIPGKMSVTLRFGSLSLSRAATRTTAAPLPIRSFSTSPGLHASGKISLGKQRAPKPIYTAKTDLAADDEKPPVNTERPLTSRDPAPDNAPASSAEVPPNANMPPPPPSMEDMSQEELMQSLERHEPPPTRGRGAKPADSHRYDAGANRPINLDLMIGEKYNQYMDVNHNPKLHDPTLQPNVRTAPVTGRTVFIDNHSNRPGKVNNPEAAFKRLDIIMSQNRIKTMWNQQRFSERPGMKRKRLKMVRWKKRFRAGFVATTKRVKELKKQGW